MVELLRNARSRGYLSARLAFDSVPEFGTSRDTPRRPSDTAKTSAETDIAVQPPGQPEHQEIGQDAARDVDEPRADTPQPAIQDAADRKAASPPIDSDAAKSTEQSDEDFDKIDENTESVGFAEAFE